jgi:hypothetical protein
MLPFSAEIFNQQGERNVAKTPGYALAKVYNVALYSTWEAK